MRPIPVLFATGAVAIVIVAVASLRGFGLSSDPGGVAPTPPPNATSQPSSTATSSAPALIDTTAWVPFTSPYFGYSIRYPAGWIETRGEGSETFDHPSGVPSFRALSAEAPEGVAVDDFIARTLTQSPDADCSPPRETLEVVVIDGREGRFRGFCGNPLQTEVEATVVVGRRVYLFTMFWLATGAPPESEVRAWFDAFASTITLDPLAVRSPNPLPS